MPQLSEFPLTRAVNVDTWKEIIKLAELFIKKIQIKDS